MKQSVTITLEETTLAALRKSAAAEHRKISQQLSLLIERELGITTPIESAKPAKKRKAA